MSYGVGENVLYKCKKYKIFDIYNGGTGNYYGLISNNSAVYGVSENEISKVPISIEVSTINHPKHYTKGKYETIDVIKDTLGKEKFKGFCLGNVIKYISRCELKNGVEDLKKAKWYLDKVIGVMEENNGSRSKYK